MQKQYTPMVLGAGEVKQYKGTKGQIIEDASVIYLSCGKCDALNVIHRMSLRKRRAQLETPQGKLIVKGFYCSSCEAVNSTQGLDTRNLPEYTPTAEPAPINGTVPTPSDDLTTASAELLEIRVLLSELVLTVKALRDEQDRYLAEINRMSVENADAIVAELKQLVELWRK